jgi:TonB family protein
LIFIASLAKLGCETLEQSSRFVLRRRMLHTEKSRVRHDLSHVEPLKDEVKRKKRSPYTILIIAVVGSLLTHLVFVVVSALMPAQEMSFDTTTAPLRTHFVSRLPPPEDEKTKQVVTIAEPKVQQKPKEPDYLAEYDQSVKEQTRSRVTSPFAAKVTDRPSQQSPGRRPSSPKESQKSAEAKKSRISPNGLLAKTEEESATEDRKLMPTWKDAGLDGGMPFNDALKNVQEDNETRLNTAQWAHATFFVRVKEAIARRWNPNRVIRRIDPTGQMIGKHERVTQLTAAIDRDGRLVSLKVTRESGVYFLDDEALKAFKDAAPFSNPPKALFARNDTFEFPFGFVLSYDKGFTFDLDWRSQ